MIAKLITTSIALAASCLADSAQIRQMYQNLASAPSAQTLPSKNEFNSVVNEQTVKQLSYSEIKSILPFVERCLKSPFKAVQQNAFGMLLLTEAFQLNSASLLEPYIADLENIANDKGSVF